MTRTSLKHQVRRRVRNLGIDLARWPSESLDYGAKRLLDSLDVDLVLDVGANDGEYGLGLRDFRYRGRIVSFEPITAARQRLNKRLDSKWDIRPWALGDRNGEMVINVAANAQASSSFLPMTTAHVESAPTAQYVDTEAVQVRRLDDVYEECAAGSNRPFLKIDVQGYEMFVLLGSVSTLTRCVGVRCEVSLTPVYNGAPSWLEVIDYLGSFNYHIARIDPGFTDPTTGVMLQVDITAVR